MSNEYVNLYAETTIFNEELEYTKYMQLENKLISELSLELSKKIVAERNLLPVKFKKCEVIADHTLYHISVNLISSEEYERLKEIEAKYNDLTVK